MVSWFYRGLIKYTSLKLFKANTWRDKGQMLTHSIKYFFLLQNIPSLISRFHPNHRPSPRPIQSFADTLPYHQANPHHQRPHLPRPHHAPLLPPPALGVEAFGPEPTSPQGLANSVLNLFGLEPSPLVASALGVLPGGVVPQAVNPYGEILPEDADYFDDIENDIYSPYYRPPTIR